MRVSCTLMLGLLAGALGGCRDPQGNGPADAGADVDGGCDAGATCTGAGGLCAPVPLCSAQAPCKNILMGSDVTDPITLPQCHTSKAGRPQFDDGAPRRWTDAETGQPRAACVFRPSDKAVHPLVVYLHGAQSSADSVYDATSLRSKAVAYALGAAPGFVLAADQGRNLVWPSQNMGGSHHDHYYRGPANPDVRNLDRLIDDLAAAGGIDEKRIYLMGWSNGSFFAQYYALLRHDAPTPGGRRVAAVALFDGGDPYQPPTADGPVGCRAPYPRSTLPLLMLHRACSIIACDPDQAKVMDQPPGFEVSAWMSALRGPIGDPNATDTIVDALGRSADRCAATPPCGSALGLVQHTRWPDGVADSSGVDHETEMLAFLAAHPLP